MRERLVALVGRVLGACRAADEQEQSTLLDWLASLRDARDQQRPTGTGWGR